MVQTSSNNNSIPLSKPSSGNKWWRDKSIRTKASIVAAILSILPTSALGIVGYSIARDSISEQIGITRQTIALDLQNEVELFLNERSRDIRVLATLDILANPRIRSSISSQERSLTLERILESYGLYNSIAFFDLQGNVLAQTGSKPLGNHSDRGYFQQALTQNKAVISQPRISTSSGVYSIYAAAPVIDTQSGQAIGIIRARIPVSALADLLEEFTVGGDDYYLVDEAGAIWLSSAEKYAIQAQSNQNSAGDIPQIDKVFQGIESLLSSASTVISPNSFNREAQSQQFLAFAPPAGSSALEPGVVVAIDRAEVLAPLKNFQQVYLLGTVAIALALSAIAYRLTKLATEPVIAAAKAVEEIGKGDLQARVAVTGTDEIALLGKNVNKMALQLDSFVREQQLLAEQTEKIKQTIFKLGEATSVPEILELIATEARDGLNCRGVAIYEFDSENVVHQILATASPPVDQATYHPEDLEQYRQPQAQAVALFLDDVSRFEFSQAQVASWQQAGIHRIAIAQIKQQGKPTHLLIAHKEAADVLWRQPDFDYLEQIVSQANFALDRLAFLQQEQAAQQAALDAQQQLQQKAQALLEKVSNLSQGDLTVRATVTDDEIGIVADSYNKTISSLQKLVREVKEAAKEVEQNAGSNQSVIDSLATNAIEQAQSMALAMQQIQKMTNSIAAVSENALEAENIVSQANATIVSGDTTMSQAVARISALQNTVSETEQKVKTLGESSQEISQVVNSISRFAAQTHLLALKASIEAARAGEQGKGFATIAEEVRSLAAQSATATSDIENLVAKIQLETGEVVSAMAEGTKQVTKGTELVKQTRQELHQVTLASQNISQLISSIAESAKGQSQISHQVKESISNVAVTAQTNSQSATQVSVQIDRLFAVATKLQSHIDKFKT